MPEPLLVLGLLLPVAALLFLNLRTFRRLSYPHHLLAGEGRRSRTAYIIGSFRTYSDIIFDACIALCLAWALSPGPPLIQKKAVVIDASASMLLGREGSRPLDKALERLRTDSSLKGARVFVLGTDPGKGGSRLYGLKSLSRGTSSREIARDLEQALPFLGFDPSPLAQLPQRGYTEISLLSDRASIKGRGLRVIELDPAAAGFPVYPSRLAWDGEAKLYKASFVASLEPEDMGVLAFQDSDGTFLRLAPGELQIEAYKGGWVLGFPRPGIFRLDMRRTGTEGLESLAFRFVDARRAYSSQGSFSSSMAKVFPLLEPNPRPRLVLADLPGAGLARQAREAKARGGFVLGTRIVPAGSDLYLSPALTGDRPILSGAYPGPGRAAGFDLVLDLGPQALANEDLPLAYDRILEASGPPAFLTAPTRKDGPLRTIQGLSFARDAWGLIPVNPPASEFFLPTTTEELRLTPPERSRWLLALLLALFAAGKLLAHRRFQGRGNLPRRP